jgi:hypothetical protein
MYLLAVVASVRDAAAYQFNKLLKLRRYPLAIVSNPSDQCPDRGRRRDRRSKMKTFTIEIDTNNITLHSTAKEAEAVPGSERFSNEAMLAKLTAQWPTARLVEIWNSLPGETPVKKFKDRATAVSRIWKALQRLDQVPPEAQEGGPVTETAPISELPEMVSEPDQEVSETALPQEAISESSEPDVSTPVAPQTPAVAPEAAAPKNRANRAKNTPVSATTMEGGAPREGSKTSQVIAMLKREGGTTLEEIMTAMGWQKHTTRAMLSAGGSLTKKHGLIVTSEKVGDKRTYSIKG